MNLLKTYAKSIAAFVAAIVANMVVSLINGTVPWPQTSAEWLQYAITSVGTAIAVHSTRNKITQDQLDTDPHVVGGTVVETPVTPLQPTTENPVGPGEYQNPWPRP